eukprot:CAMPEP_0181459996 /NCGR_PEP_ID=MMETSP1110-20121109/33113_1 /TAXON_ID=174948 /ORGANISM="Symbiodinium sp., Strain CCMP421" /LENGTH=371 /DNA_ID=CAMNT_0023584533 /DNA_START=35 /DNA_END=1151 /DNA_ORIENTATION=+
MAPSKQVALVDAMANEAKLFERQATSLSASTVDKERPEGWTSLYGFERVANFRDFAGPDPSAVYRCEGGHLKQGLLYRTGHWVTATPADLCLIRELDVRTYLDLRNGQEFESVDAECFDDFPPSPNGRHDASVPREPGERRRVGCPFSKGLGPRPLTGKEEVDPEDKKAVCELWFQKQLRSEAFHDVQVQLKTSMRAMLILNSDEVLKALETLTDERNYPAAFGCTSGKDRTGLLACLLHSVLGVKEEDIIDTNEASYHINACNQIAVAMWFEELRICHPRKYNALVKRNRLPANAQQLLEGDMETPLWEDVNVVSDPEAIKRSMVHPDILEYIMREVLDKEFGGALGYLQWIGFGLEQRERLREILVESE